MSNLSGHGQLTGVIRTGSDGGGSEVIINPSGTPIGTMEKISVDGKIYEVRNVPDASSATNGDILTKTASGVGWYPPTKEIPVFTSGDNNKVLTIKNNALTWGEVPEELPAFTSSDEGKVLGVSDGDLSWISSGGDVSYSTNERVVGTWIDGITPVYELTIFNNNLTDTSTLPNAMLIGTIPSDADIIIELSASVGASNHLAWVSGGGIPTVSGWDFGLHITDRYVVLYGGSLSAIIGGIAIVKIRYIKAGE